MLTIFIFITNFACGLKNARLAQLVEQRIRNA